MKAPVRFWIHLGSQLGIFAILAWLPATMVGAFVTALAGQPALSSSSGPISLVGTVFGFCVITLLFVGAVAVTGELLGLIRFYGRNADDRQEVQPVYRKALLVAVAVLAWGAVISLAALFMMIRPA
ncbi:hypothetical protein ACLB90_14425 [Stenotrophomonas sp. LGBM10]|uniref:hypothetical protein n=1 Tax=Stenotrophomonas sp. LGBM10 TaxID=3390038 RepID=UPI00398B2857